MNCDPQFLASKAACFKSCLSGSSLEAVRTYLLCKMAASGAIGQNLIPSGAQYSGGAEYDLTVQANTTYAIVWGANDLSMTLCGVSYPSTGAGTTTTVYTDACTLMQFFGTFGGTTVTAKVMVSPNIPTASGLAFVPVNSTQVKASWPPGACTVVKADYTEVWTSLDNITFTLNTTVNCPNFSATFAGPTLGQTMYCKIRWCKNTGPTCGGFSPVSLVNGVVADWASRVVTNGGAFPSSSTLTALNNFVSTLVTNGLDTLMSYVLPFPPDSLIAATTPLYKTGFSSAVNDPATNHNFVAGDVSVNGLNGNGSTKYLDTGCLCSTSVYYNAGSPSASTIGMSVYLFDAQGSGFICPMASCNTSSGTECGIELNWAVTPNQPVAYTCYSGTVLTGGVGGGSVGMTGLMSGNRTGLTAAAIYRGTDSSFTTLGTTASNLSSPPAFATTVFCRNSQGTKAFFYTGRISFAAIHGALTAAQAQTFFNAVQALRKAFGGGWV